MFQSIISCFAQCVYLFFVMGQFFNTSCHVRTIEEVTEIISQSAKMNMFLLQSLVEVIECCDIVKIPVACIRSSFTRLELYSSFPLCAVQVDSKISEAFSVKDLNRLSRRETSSKLALSAIMSFKGD